MEGLLERAKVGSGGFVLGGGFRGVEAADLVFDLRGDAGADWEGGWEDWAYKEENSAGSRVKEVQIAVRQERIAFNRIFKPSALSLSY